jgi:hypothetical protein
MSGVLTKGSCCYIFSPHFAMDTRDTTSGFSCEVWKMCYSDLLPELAMSTLRGAHGVDSPKISEMFGSNSKPNFKLRNCRNQAMSCNIYMEPVWTWRHFGNSMQQLIGIIGIIGSYGAFDDNFEVMAVIFVVSILLESALTLDVWRSSSRRP